MRALVERTYRWLHAARRHARPALVACALIGIPVLFGQAAYSWSRMLWIVGEGNWESRGAFLSYVQRQGAVIEKAAYATGSPSVAVETVGGIGDRQWRLVSGGRILLSNGDGLSEQVPRYVSNSGTWFDRRTDPGRTWTSIRVDREDEGIVLRSEGMPCGHILHWISPYARGRIRAAWGVDASVHAVPDGSWGAVGDALRICRAGPPDGKGERNRQFLMLFEMPKTTSGTTTAPRG